MPKYNVTIIFDNKDREEILGAVNIDSEGDTITVKLENGKRVVLNWNKITYYILEELEGEKRR